MLEAGVKPFEVPVEAGISKDTPLEINSWGFVMARTQKKNPHAYKLFLGRGMYIVHFCIKLCSYVDSVETMYSKGGGKNGKHGMVSKAENIAALSYIGLQIFEYDGSAFRTITTQTYPFQILSYTFIPSIRFFARTQAMPHMTRTPCGEMVHLKCAADIVMYQRLANNLPKLTVFLKNHAKRQRRKSITAIGPALAPKN